MSRTYGSYMLQPTKDQYRWWLADARKELKEEKAQRRLAEYKLDVAVRKLGSLVLEGKIAISVERLGEIVLQMAQEEEVERERAQLLTQE